MRDLSRYARQTTTRLIIGFIVILFTVGLGLVYIFYGQGGALLGLLCLLLGLAPLLLIWLVLGLLDWVTRIASRDP
jgi:hypothetical protein